MGIQGLNKHIQNNCYKAINKITLLKLKNKTIVIDASIYMYKFLTSGNLIEGIYSMVSMLQYYNITPIFIFDGKMPDEKYDTLSERKEYRENALTNYNSLIEEYKTSKNKKKLYEEIVILKRQCVKLTNNNILDTKNLLKAMGVLYYQSQSEADIICVELVNQDIAYACMSDDTDMFVYGCKRVLRYFSLQMENCILYNYNMILDELNLTNDEFKIICIASGTDYNKKKDNYLSKTLNYYKIFKEGYNNQDNKNKAIEFLKFLVYTVKYIEMDTFTQIYNMFQLSDHDLSYVYNDISIVKPNKKQLKEILVNNSFIYIE